MTITINKTNAAKIVNAVIEYENSLSDMFHVNYDKVYQPLLDLMKVRNDYKETQKTGVQKAMLAWDQNYSIRDKSGNYRIRAKTMSAAKFALDTPKERLFEIATACNAASLEGVYNNRNFDQEPTQRTRGNASASKTPARQSNPDNISNWKLPEIVAGILADDKYGDVNAPEIVALLGTIAQTLCKDNGVKQAAFSQAMAKTKKAA